MLTKKEIERFKPYELFNKDIDAQHLEIYELLITMWKTVPPDAIPQLLVDVLRSVTLHFQFEEALMEESNYPFVESHKESHVRIREKFTQSILFPTTQIVDDLITAHLHHIDFQDRVLAMFLNSDQHRRSTDKDNSK